MQGRQKVVIDYAPKAHYARLGPVHKRLVDG